MNLILLNSTTFKFNSNNVCYHMLEIQFNGIELRKHFNSLQTFIGYQIYFTRKSKLFKARNLLNQTFVHKISFSMWMCI